jgi:multisubunit Na+/H+ antiporter MnhG subunit
MLSTILQSTRGIMSVILGAVLARYGWEKLEGTVDHSVLLKRLLAAVFMTISISIYVIANGID